ncbi:Transmembrane protein [Plasmodiophora brassicae]
MAPMATTRAAVLFIGAILLVSMMCVADAAKNHAAGDKASGGESKVKQQSAPKKSLIDASHFDVARLKAQLFALSTEVKDLHTKSPHVVYTLVFAGVVIGLLAASLLGGKQRSRGPKLAKRKLK